MTDDVKEPIAASGDTPQVTTTPQGSEPTTTPPVESKETTPTPDKPGTEEERTVPLSVLIEERRKNRERIRALQQGRSTRGQSTDTSSQTAGSTIDQNYVAQLQTRVAISELQDFARQKVKDYPDLPKYLKRAIINNPRGFIKTTTSNVEAGKLDIEDYLEDEQARYEDEQLKANPPQPKKTVQVAGNNKPDAIQPGKTPADIQKILETPVDEWTAADKKTLAEYRASHT